jgi:hypothetical protein
LRHSRFGTAGRIGVRFECYLSPQQSMMRAYSAMKVSNPHYAPQDDDEYALNPDKSIVQGLARLQGRVSARIACGARHVVVRLTNRTVVSVGNGVASPGVPETAAKADATVSFTAGDAHSLFLLKDNTLLQVCWRQSLARCNAMNHV